VIDVGDELVDWVDESDRVIGQVTRSRMRREKLLHRVVAVLCLNSAAEIYVHRRTQTKDLFPGLYDMFTAGTVTTGEGYDESARRELEEELGIASRQIALERLFQHRYEGPETRSHTVVYRVIWDGPIVHQPSEIAWGEFRTREALLTNAARFEFVPDGAELFARYVTMY
jgi:isopentenyldiphosphate isomerase